MPSKTYDPRNYTKALERTRNENTAIDGLDRRNTMARDVGYRRGCVVNSFTEEVQKELGLLVFSIE
jgi:hypothetical protein